MKMIDLKLPKKSTGEVEPKSPSIEREQWPYGMQLRFESDQVDKMPQLKNMKIGAKVDVSGVGEIASIHMREEKEGKENWTIEIQMHQIGVEGKSKSQESMIDAMKSHRKNMTMGK